MRDKDTILLEQTYESIYFLQEDVKLAKQLVQQGKLSEEDFNTIMTSMQIRPDCRKHIGWIAKQWIAGNKDIDELRNNVTEWEDLAKRGKTIHKDIARYNFETLKADVQKANSLGMNVSSGELERDFEIIQDDQNLLIVVPHSHESSRKHGLGEFACRVAEDGTKDSKWCTTHRSRTHFDKYYFNFKDTLYYIKVRSEALQEQLKAAGFGSEFYVSSVVTIGPSRIKEIGHNQIAYNSLDQRFDGERLNRFLSIIGIKPESLVHRRAEEERNKNFDIALKKQIQEYIKNGSQGDLEFVESTITSLPNDLTVGGNLSLLECPKLTQLPENLTVKGILDLSGSENIKALPKGLSVGKNLFAVGTSVESISPDIRVGWSLYLSYTPIAKQYTSQQLKRMLPGVAKNIDIQESEEEEEGEW